MQLRYMGTRINVEENQYMSKGTGEGNLRNNELKGDNRNDSILHEM
jgi:hypothetical protein